MLEARDTPIFNDKSGLDTQRLITVFAALSQRLNRFSKTYVVLQWSTKVVEPLLLIDGTDPTFNNWKLQLQDKLNVNMDHFLIT